MQNKESQRNTVAAQLGKMEQELADSSAKSAGGWEWLVINCQDD